jgi:hypothetical protein
LVALRVSRIGAWFKFTVIHCGSSFELGFQFSEGIADALIQIRVGLFQLIQLGLIGFPVAV